ncbi:hypothetical protein CEXT_805421 [Caerostris extrusa]|uniref:Uncharacterized protein n=1 Tax=Caerostris extrusa TaxID=172846 RepID=A0AAV4W5P4_CAEEX|nr:hypothetical protein CEXT_805421 [Caerostris extrusa]
MGRTSPVKSYNLKESLFKKQNSLENNFRFIRSKFSCTQSLSGPVLLPPIASSELSACLFSIHLLLNFFLFCSLAMFSFTSSMSSLQFEIQNFQFHKDEFIWDVKENIIDSLPKELKESFNYGIFALL